MNNMEYLPEYYNDEIKKVYLYSLTGNKETLKDYKNMIYTFKKVKTFEEKFHKDLYNFTLDELTECMNECKWITSDVFNIRSTLIKKYTQWALDHQYTYKNNQGVFSINYSNITGSNIFEEEYYESLSELIKTIEAVYSANGYDENYILMTTVMYGLVWYGFEASDIPFITKNTFIDYCKMIYNRRYIVIDRELYEKCMQAFNITECVIGDDEYGRRTRYAPESDFMLKNFYVSQEMTNDNENLPVDIKNFSTNRRVGWKKSLDKVQDEKLKKKKLNMIAISKSGRYRKMWDYENMFMNGENITAKEYNQLFNYDGRYDINKSKMFLEVKSYFHWRKYFMGY